MKYTEADLEQVKFRNKYRIPSARLKNWNYANNGYYFVTVCTNNREIKNKFGPQSKNLASIIRGFKIGVKKWSQNQQILFNWQSRYYDHIVRNEQTLIKIRQYIIDNPKNWQSDRNNSENLYM